VAGADLGEDVGTGRHRLGPEGLGRRSGGHLARHQPAQELLELDQEDHREPAAGVDGEVDHPPVASSVHDDAVAPPVDDHQAVTGAKHFPAGAQDLQKRSIGFSDNKQAGDELQEIKRMFTPEFRNRLDATISFRALDEEIIMRVVDKFLLELESQLAEKKVEVAFTDKLRAHLAKKGFDPLMGARPMQRLIQDTVRRALADELLFGRLVDGGRLTVDVDDAGNTVLDIQPPKKSDKPKAEPATTS
jgi:hypothetical protein